MVGETIMSVDGVRMKILDASLELFSQRGFDGTSMDDIAKACGMKAPNLYKYFKGKQEILGSMHILAEGAYRTHMSMQPDSIVWIHDAPQLKEFSLHQMRYTMRNTTVRRLRKMCLIEQFRNEHFKKEMTAHQFDNLLKLHQPIFKNLMDMGRIPKMDVDQLSIMYFSPISLLLQICDREPERDEEILGRIEEYIDFFISRIFIPKKDAKKETKKESKNDEEKDEGKNEGKSEKKAGAKNGEKVEKRVEEKEGETP